MSNYLKLKTGLSFLAVLMFSSACTGPQPLNKWQHDAVSVCNNYQTHFLQDKATRAALDLRHARGLATRSAQLKTLLDIELTHCAMELGALNQHPCERAERILELEPNPSQYAYFDLLTAQLKEEDIALLPSQYHRFAKAFLRDDKMKVNEALEDLKPITSRLIASALAKESISDENVQALIEGLSFHGYKRPLLVWLDLQMQREEDTHKKAQLQKKISILTSN